MKHSDRYTILPDKVIRDVRLSAQAVRVYAVLAGSIPIRNRQARSVQLGLRLLAEQACVSLPTLRQAVRSLQDCGHLAVAGKGNLRRRYTLLSSAYESARKTVNDTDPFTNRKVVSDWIQGKGRYRNADDQAARVEEQAE